MYKGDKSAKVFSGIKKHIFGLVQTDPNWLKILPYC